MSISQWIQQGARFEDQSFLVVFGRFYNHFHNPICPSPWTGCQPPWPNAGLNTPLFGISIGESALLWAQNAGLSDRTNTDWSWQAVRQDYYEALTATADANRNSLFAKTFEGIGHVIHLIQDMSQPAHVRNDAHPIDGTGHGNGLEAWAVTQEGQVAINEFLGLSSTIPPLPQGPGLANLAPITKFWDTDRYDGTTATLPAVSDPNIGLAEYTNANYFSEDTIAAPAGSRYHFNFPSTDINDYSAYIDDAPTGSQGQKRWYLYRAGSASAHTFAGSFLRAPNEPQPSAITSNLVLDAKVHEDYSRDLIPRAVGYSVGLINYFFRGQIALSLPNRGVYSISDGSGAFTNFKVKAKNVSTPTLGSTTPDAMSNGTIQLVIKYNLAMADPFRPVWVGVEPTKYIIVPEHTGQRAISSEDTGTELDFDLSQPLAQLPIWATNVHAYVVYRGVLGDEQDAVAVGYKDVSEPTPFTMANGMDYVCLNGAWYVAGSDAALQAVDTNHNGIADEADIYAHGIMNAYLRLSQAGAPNVGNASNYTALFAGVPQAQFGKIFVITDGITYSAGQSATRINLDSRDTLFSPFPSSGTLTLNSVKRQSEWVNGIWTDIYFAFPQWRGVTGWPIWTWFNTVYGSGTCLTDELSGTAPNLTGPVLVTPQ